MTSRKPARVVKFGVFELDLLTDELRNRGIRIKLQQKPFHLLAMLLEKPGELVTRAEIAARLWPDTYIDLDRALGVTINKVRQALCDTAKNPRFIETLARRGYRFIAALSPVEQRSLLAVLPFDNAGGSPGQKYFVDGLTEEMTAQLGRIDPKRLGVIAYHTARQFKNESIAQVAEALKVDYVLLGSVRRADHKLRITAELVQTNDQTQLWNQTYEQSLRDIVSVQAEVAARIAESLALELLPQQRELIAKTGTSNPQAYEFYLQGRSRWSARTDEAILGAIALFNKAVAADPEYALAYAGLADCYNVLGYYGSISPQEAFSNAKANALKAQNLNASLAEAHASYAFALLQHDWDWPAADREHQESLRLNANYASAHHWYGLNLTQVGKLEEASARLQRALELNPLSVAVLAHLARVSYFEKEYAAAAQRLASAVRRDKEYVPARYFLGLVLIQRGEYVKAIRELDVAIRLAPDHPVLLSALALANTKASRHCEAAAILERLNAVGRQRRVEPFFRAFAILGTRRSEEVFTYLEQAYEERFGWLLYLPIEPVFDELRDHPRFVRLLRKVRLSGHSSG